MVPGDDPKHPTTVTTVEPPDSPAPEGGTQLQVTNMVKIALGVTIGVGLILAAIARSYFSVAQ